MRSPRVENGTVVGTASNKYETRNPIARAAIAQLLNTIAKLVADCNPSSILEVGCGEGKVTRLLLETTEAAVHATDLSSTLVEEVRRDLAGSPRLTLEQANIYDLDDPRFRSDLVVCCEVLEHLERPAEGLRRLAENCREFAVLSVPREPNFRILNFLRGQHFSALGNAPGHVQHWSTSSFARFVESEFELLQVRPLLPWTVVLAKPRSPTA